MNSLRLYRTIKINKQIDGGYECSSVAGVSAKDAQSPGLDLQNLRKLPYCPAGGSSMATWYLGELVSLRKQFRMRLQWQLEYNLIIELNRKVPGQVSCGSWQPLGRMERMGKPWRWR